MMDNRRFEARHHGTRNATTRIDNIYVISRPALRNNPQRSSTDQATDSNHQQRSFPVRRLLDPSIAELQNAPLRSSILQMSAPNEAAVQHPSERSSIELILDPSEAALQRYSQRPSTELILDPSEAALQHPSQRFSIAQFV